jgi:hypothetical protein
MQTKTYHEQTRGWGYHSTMFLILLNVLVIALIFLLMNGNPGQKWLENRLYQEPKVHTYEHQDTQAQYETRKPLEETRKPLEPPTIVYTNSLMAVARDPRQ